MSQFRKQTNVNLYLFIFSYGGFEGGGRGKGKDGQYTTWFVVQQHEIYKN